jgi:mRNA interferase MazF
MKNLSANEVVIVRYPFSDLSASKIRPAVIISSPHVSKDVFIVPLTSRTDQLLEGEFHWKSSGLNVPSAVKRGVFTISKDIIIRP